MAPTDFHHPFEPYPIQEQFMTALFDCIEQGKIGIFESPTGTGKSLSLICGSLTWLRMHKREQIQAAVAHVDGDEDEPEWILKHARNERRMKILQHRQDLETRLAKVRQKEKKIKERYDSGEPLTKRRRVVNGDEDDADEDRFLLDDYQSDDDVPNGPKNILPSGISAETHAILKKHGMFTGIQAEEDQAETPDELKIFYCSRTHSQLSQFANELRRVRLPPVMDENGPLDSMDTSIEVAEELKHLTLGSRKNLCINAKVSRLGNATAINEKCVELQQSKTSPDCKCEYLPNKENEALVNEFRDHALAQVRDIEDLANVGRKIGICPYYASRSAVKPSEIVTLPYPLLLQKSVRETLDISLKDHVVVIDEAHNLMDAIASMYSATISLAQLELGRGQLMIYLQKFRNRLKGKNRVYVTQIVRVLDSLISCAKSKLAGDVKSLDGSVLMTDLMAGKSVDQINLFKLVKYIQESKLARKVDGYFVFAENEAQLQINGRFGKKNQSAPSEPSTPILLSIQGFLMTLMNPSKEGRFFYTRTEDGKGITLQYMLLDPTFHFREIVDEARAVILAGGTMSPMDDYIKHLFAYVPNDRIMTLSCDHVIPTSNLIAWTITQDSNGHEFDFTFQNRQSKTTLQSAGQTLLELLRQIPDGVVVFFSSYAYLDSCVQAWKQPTIPSRKSLWDEISSIKEIFLEPRSSASTPPIYPEKTGPAATEALLTAYSTAITHPSTPFRTGAVLLSVINGSLSEGINFSDRLGRSVIVFGLPFPNPHSATWKAKMEYIASKEATPTAGKSAAREFYENATMRAVNQAVGRAIRHKGDYANIFLVDRRYGSERVRGKLPGWIRGSLRGVVGMEVVLEETRGFFERKKIEGL